MKDKLKVLYIDFTLPYVVMDAEYTSGGSAVQLNNWANGLIKKNHVVGVLSWEGAEAYTNNTEIEFIDTYNPNKGIRVVKYLYNYFPKILIGMRKFRPDIAVQSCCGVNTGLMGIASKICGIPFVYRAANDMDADDRCKDRLKYYEYCLYKLGLSISKGIICQNEYQYECFRKKYPNKKISIIHNPFDVDRLLPDVTSRDNRNYVSWVGVFSKQKNMKLLYLVASSLPNITFKIAGKEWSGVDSETKEYVAKLADLDNVDFVGYLSRNEIPEFINNSVLLLNTSDYEGFSNTYLEAFNQGVPVVCQRKVDPDGIIYNNKLGASVQEEPKLITAIEEIYSLNIEKYSLISMRVSAYLESHHSLDTKVDELISCYGEIIDGN